MKNAVTLFCKSKKLIAKSMQHTDLMLRHLLHGRCAFCLARPSSLRPWCNDCFAVLPWNLQACHQCAEPLVDTSLTFCGHCLKAPPPYDIARVGLRYEGEVAVLVQRFKFAGEPRAGTLLIDLMHASLSRLSSEERPEMLVAVPRHPLRTKEFGFDQAVWLTQQLSRRLEIPCLIARRVRSTPTQRGLDRRARLRNVQDAFVLDAALPAHVAVVDDIMTTGASLGALAKICREVGARRVEAWAVARTPLESS